MRLLIGTRTLRVDTMMFHQTVPYKRPDHACASHPSASRHTSRSYYLTLYSIIPRLLVPQVPRLPGHLHCNLYNSNHNASFVRRASRVVSSIVGKHSQACLRPADLSLQGFDSFLDIEPVGTPLEVCQLCLQDVQLADVLRVQGWSNSL